jgi:pimeloyl-ACP methyl ester carboxylesterase
MTTVTLQRPETPTAVDFVEAGAGPAVMLVHSSVSGARQWHRLMDDLKNGFHVRAVNLYGYGKTAPWPGERAQTLDDQARPSSKPRSRPALDASASSVTPSAARSRCERRPASGRASQSWCCSKRTRSIC